MEARGEEDKDEEIGRRGTSIFHQTSIGGQELHVPRLDHGYVLKH